LADTNLEAPKSADMANRNYIRYLFAHARVLTQKKLAVFQLPNFGNSGDFGNLF
jgi:hypothetical protein